MSPELPLGCATPRPDPKDLFNSWSCDRCGNRFATAWDDDDYGKNGVPVLCDDCDAGPKKRKAPAAASPAKSPAKRARADAATSPAKRPRADWASEADAAAAAERAVADLAIKVSLSDGREVGNAFLDAAGAPRQQFVAMGADVTCALCPDFGRNGKQIRERSWRLSLIHI